MRGIAFLPAIVAACLSGCGQSENPKEPEQVAASTPAPVQSHAVGETVTVSGLEITITSVSEAKKPSDGPYAPEAGEGEIFVIAQHEMKNIGTEPIPVDDLPEVELVDGKGVVYEQDGIAGAYAHNSGENDPFGKVNPGITYRSAGVWKVAKDALDRATWKIVVDTDPHYEVSLK